MQAAHPAPDAIQAQARRPIPRSARVFASARAAANLRRAPFDLPDAGGTRTIAVAPRMPGKGPRAVDTFLQQMINGVTLGSVYAIVALGYTMVYGIIQLINCAHGEVVMIGAMTAYSVIVALVGAHVALPPLAI